MAYGAIQISDRWMDPNFKFFVNRKGSVKERMSFLCDERMNDEYLGACLDYIRWGSINTVMYEMGTPGMINFIQQWMSQNEGNLIWNERGIPEDFTLPYIKNDKCPRNNSHTRVVRDGLGRKRCGETSERRFKPSFYRSYKQFDSFSGLNVTKFYEDEPRGDAIPEDAWDEEGKLNSFYETEWSEHQKNLARFKEEEASLVVLDACYAVISDEDCVLSLEDILDRLNLEPKYRVVRCGNGFSSSCDRLYEFDEEERKLYESLGWCQGHEEENSRTVHPFDGWYLAWYVQKWYEQVADGQAPFFEKDKRELTPRGL